jgi:carbonic anhydrase
MRSSRAAGVLFASGLAVWGCGEEQLHSEDPRITLHGHEAHWSYSGDDGPEFWGLLSQDYALCSQGKDQSPVNLPSTLLPPEELSHLQIGYASSRGTLRDNGHTIVVELNGNNELIVDEESYELVQFHFHAQSEHQVDKEHYPLELHLVHTSSSGGLAVLGVFVAEGEHNESLAEVFQAMSEASGDPLPLETQLDLPTLVPAEITGWNYPGSLTTPPCTEGVHWNVLATPLTASAAQIGAFSALHAGSNRPVVPNSHIKHRIDKLKVK